MRKRTTTGQLNSAITNNLLQVKKAECHYKSSSRIDEISRETFMDNLAFINESGVFSGFIDWHYEKNLSEKDEYIFDSGAMNPYSENVVIAHLSAGEGTSREDIDKALRIVEE